MYVCIQATIEFSYALGLSRCEIGRTEQASYNIYALHAGHACWNLIVICVSARTKSCYLPIKKVTICEGLEMETETIDVIQFQ